MRTFNKFYLSGNKKNNYANTHNGGKNMKGLKCTTTNCELNYACHCQAGVINISQNAVCNTKIKKGFLPIKEEYSNFEAANEFDYDENDDVLIQCDSVKCIYNNDHICSADLVNVKDGIIKTKCVTKKILN